MKIYELVYDIRESLSQYQDDSEISDEYIIYLINNYRSKILKNELNNLQIIVNPMIVQNLCLELEEVSALDCGIDYCKTIVRTKRPVPIPIKTHVGPAILSVRTIDKFSKTMTMIPQESVPHFINSKFAKSIYYFLDTDMHIYFISKEPLHKLIDCVRVSGIFSDPFELKDYKDCCGCDDDDNSCFDEYETVYPIAMEQASDVVGLVLERLVGKLRIPKDKTNNADDE